jgi:hypothetical protein
MTAETILDFNVVVTLDGLSIDGIKQLNIVNTNSYSCDTFSVSLVVGRSPLTSASFWTEIQGGQIDVVADLKDGRSGARLITGRIDTMHMDPLRQIVVLEGRDLSAGLIDAYRQQDFVNQSASEIVTTIALQHGLEPIVTTTAGNVGRYYSDGFTRLSLGQYSKYRSDWDTIVQLGRQSGFDVFVQGTSLYFQPAAQPIGAPVLVSANDLLTMRVERSLYLDPDSQVSVRSWNSQDMASYSNQPNQYSNSTIDPISNQGYLFTDANLTASQVDSFAGQLGTELGRLRTVLHLEMPWNLKISARSLILLTDTQSSLNGLYVVDSLERDYSTVHGSTQRIRAIIPPQASL